MINIANFGNFTKNSNHIEIHCHYVHENVKGKLTEIIKINTNGNITDNFIKALCRKKFEKFRMQVNVR